MSDLARALLDDLASDSVALARLRELVAADEQTRAATSTVYTVATLAAELGRSERSIRAAIKRGELDAVRRGRGYVISADAVENWARAPAARDAYRPRRRRSGATSEAGPMRRALMRDRA